MNYYPGQGFTTATGILGNTVGQSYPAPSYTLVLCSLFGTLVLPDGTAPYKEYIQSGRDPNTGRQTSLLKRIGIEVTASITPGQKNIGKIFGTDRLTATTDPDSGYFQLLVAQGLTYNISCPSFGKTVSVPTVGLTSIDLSTFF